MIKIVFFNLLLLTYASTLLSQLPQHITIKIDSILNTFSNTAKPGFAISVVKDKQIVYLKSNGIGNLDYNVPITTASVFPVASLSKQFTAFCVALLNQRGQLSLDDDIRLYLPYVPDYKQKITIRNLLNHTSGLRDEWQNLEIAGYRLDDVITQEQILKMVAKEHELNSKPGERFSYCNTGYILLAEVVKKVSGLTLKAFSEKEIFQPLGMINTQFQDNYKEVVRNKVYSYEPLKDSLFQNSILNYSVVGSTGLLTNAEDIAKWLVNFETGQVGGKKMVDSMYRAGGYSFGFFIDEFKGWKRIGHGGADAGYRSYLCHFPQKNLSIALFSNLSTFNARVNALKIADLLLEDNSKTSSPIVAIQSDNTTNDRYIGKYVSNEGFVGEVLADNGHLFLTTSNKPYSMTKIGEDEFYVAGWEMKIKFDVGIKTKSKGFTMNGASYVKRAMPFNMAAEELRKYEGIYYNEELEVKYHILYKKGQLVLSYKRFDETPLTFVSLDQCQSDYEGMENIIFYRNSEGNVLGFEVNSSGGRVLHLKFKKISDFNR